jgi:hypothetical protein
MSTKEVNHSMEPPTKKVKKVKKAVPEVKVEGVKDDEKNKAPNFHSDEDELLACAWVSASDNPIVGVGQKSTSFWADVHSRYCKLQERSSSPETKFPRTWNQLKGRFLRHIQVHVNVFNRFYKRAADNIPSGSGSTVTSIMERAMADYLEELSKPFRFSQCVPILHKLPKFDPMANKSNKSNDGTQQQPTIGGVMGNNLERPIGSKAAKLIKKEEIGTNNNVTAIRSGFTTLVQSQIRKEEFEELIALGKYYRSIGDSESLAENNKALQVLIKEHRKARETLSTPEPMSVPSAPLSVPSAPTVPSVIEVTANEILSTDEDDNVSTGSSSIEVLPV